MLRLVADENFDNRILRGIRRENSLVDIVRVQDTEIYQADDPTVLEWSANESRVLLTHDVKTMIKYAHERIDDGKLMTGLIVVNRTASIGEIIDDLLLTIEAMTPEEFINQIVYIPIK